MAGTDNMEAACSCVYELTGVFSFMAFRKPKLYSMLVQRVANNAVKPSCSKLHLPTALELQIVRSTTR